MIRYEIRQFVRTVVSGRHEVVFETISEREARLSYAELVRDHPAEYFELVRVQRTEQCLAFTPKESKGYIGTLRPMLNFGNHSSARKAALRDKLAKK